LWWLWRCSKQKRYEQQKERQRARDLQQEDGAGEERDQRIVSSSRSKEGIKKLELLVV
jgi:hypothetical protein